MLGQHFVDIDIGGDLGIEGEGAERDGAAVRAGYGCRARYRACIGTTGAPSRG